MNGGDIMAFRNFLTQIKNHKCIMSLLFFTQIIAVISILIFYGVFYNSQYSINELNGLEKVMTVRFNYMQLVNEGDGSFMGKLQSKLPGILHSYEDNINGCKLDAYYQTDSLQSLSNYDLGDGKKYISIFSELAFSNGKFVKGLLYRNMKGDTSGWFSDEENNAGAAVCVTTNGLVQHSQDTIELAGKQYKVCGEYSEGSDFGIDLILPFLAVPQGAVPYELYINFKTPLLGKDYNQLKDKLTETFGDVLEVDERYVVEIDEKSTFISTMVIAGMMVIIAAICISIIYKYLFKKNTDRITAYLMCGAKGTRIYKMYLVEIFISAGISVLVGYLVFILGLKNMLKKYFMYFDIIFDGVNHLSVIGIYLLVVMVFSSILFINIIRLTPKEVMIRSSK